MKLGLLVVGPSDKDSLVTLVRRIYEGRGISAGIVARVLRRGWILDARKVVGIVRGMVSQHPELRKVVSCVDCECTEPKRIRYEADRTQREIRRLGLQRPVQYSLVVHALEGWLMTEYEAVGRVLGVPQTRPIRNEPESECKPADVLEELFARHGMDFSKTIHDSRIAAEADPELMRQRSESFNHFVQAVVDL